MIRLHVASVSRNDNRIFVPLSMLGSCKRPLLYGDWPNSQERDEAFGITIHRFSRETSRKVNRIDDSIGCRCSVHMYVPCTKNYFAQHSVPDAELGADRPLAAPQCVVASAGKNQNPESRAVT